MKIAYLEARTHDGKLIWTEGCDADGYSNHQVIVPLHYFSYTEQSKIGDKSSGYPWAYLRVGQSGNVNLGDNEAKDITCDFDLFSINIKYLDIN